MNDYIHTVTINKKRCIGCTRCLRVCPTKALRIRNGKAVILKDRCIDCGECMRVCPQNAIEADIDDLEEINNYNHKLLVYSSVLIGQFTKYKNFKKILSLFSYLGFDEIVGVDIGALIISDTIRSYLKANNDKTYITTNCPAVVRLIQVKYPSLIDNLLPFKSMLDVAGEYLKREYIKENNVSSSNIGLFYLSPCPAKAVAIYQPEGEVDKIFDGVFSMEEVYNNLRYIMEKKDIHLDKDVEMKKVTKNSLLWSTMGDVERQFKDLTSLRIDGIDNVIEFLEEMEEGNIKDINLVDMYSCQNGCVGGVFTNENPFISEYRIKQIASDFKDKIEEVPPICEGDFCSLTKALKPRPLEPLDKNMKNAVKKMQEIEKVFKKLPKLNCSICGSPTCYNLAEDIVLNENVTIYDCPVVLRRSLRNMAKDLFEMAGRTDPIEEKKDK
ncbi:MAG TPA: [Fe-Fe] hydrogenase large subunit C-terminal domain-containing protein [Candidatus Mcinerneyibacterium sp.]|nr:[Fe-Fe] hydrogenase large subunit C-terminal domain-containing protein [Candidatus Mcinerneyibacterium sp.]